MQYLVSGHPRVRSAWLCALLNAHGSRCVHDLETNGYPLSIICGVSDPGIAMLRPYDACRYNKGASICLTRRDWRQAFERWAGVSLSDKAAQAIDENVQRYKALPNVYHLDYKMLENSTKVAEVIELCTRKPADPNLIKIFQQLKIEQHIEKAQFAYSVSMLESAT